MAKITNKDANWTTVDVDTLPPELYNRHSAYKAAYADMKAIRKDFEDAMSAAIASPAGKRVIFGYNFGKLSVAIVDGDVAKPKAAASTQSLADWIASQRASGRNS